LRPCSAVTLAARALAWAASRVSRAAVVRVRRAVVVEGDEVLAEPLRRLLGLAARLRRAVVLAEVARERGVVVLDADPDVARLGDVRAPLGLRAGALRGVPLRWDEVVVEVSAMWRISLSVRCSLSNLELS